MRDTGIGVPADKLRHVFDAFTQADTSTTRIYGGTGLGLAISQHLVALRGGMIGAESEASRGSTFWFTARFAPALAAEAPDAAVSLGGCRVLIVDDNTTNRLILLKMLEARDCRPPPPAAARRSISSCTGRASASRSTSCCSTCRCPGSTG